VGEGTAQVLPTRLAKAIAAIGFAILAIRLLWFSSESEALEPKPQKSPQ
jgi:putative Ca2+/H+ antiporter (TMEM165/GDT1 family)